MRLFVNDGVTGAIVPDNHDNTGAAPWRDTAATQTNFDSNFLITWEDSNFHTKAYWICQTLSGPDNQSGPAGASTLVGAFDAIPIRPTEGSNLTFHIVGATGAFFHSSGPGAGLEFETTAETNPSGGALFSIEIDINPSPSTALSFSRSGNDITILLGTDGGGAPNSTDSDVKTAWPYGSDVTITKFGPGTNIVGTLTQQYLLGDHTATYTVTASDLSWSLLHDNYYPGAMRGYKANLRIHEVSSGSPYYNISDTFKTQYPPSDDPIMDYAGALALATAQWPATTDWFTTSLTNLAKVGSHTVPTTKKAGQKFTFGVTFVDPRGGSATFGSYFVQPFTTSGVAPSFNPGIVTGGPSSFTATDVQIFDAGGWQFIGYNGGFGIFGDITITPGDPSVLQVDVPPTTIYSNGPCTSLGGPQIPIRGTRRDGSTDVTVGTSQGIVVRVYDAYGNQCYDAAPLAVTVTLEETGSPAVAATLVGTTSVMAINGIALFKDLRVTGLSKTTRLRFSSTGLTSVTQDVNPAVLGKISSPATAKVGVPVTVNYALADFQGNTLVVPSADIVNLTNGPRSGGVTPASVVPTLSIASFSVTFSSPGTFNLKLQGSGATYVDPGLYTPDIAVTS